MVPRNPKPPRSRPPSATKLGRIEVLLEDMRAQNRATIEAVLSTRQALEAKLDAQRLELLGRIEALEVAVRMNSEDIRRNSADIRQNSADIRQNTADIRQNTADIQRVLEKLDGKVDAVELARLEQRVAALERQAHSG
jgi:hypothetical protein